MKWLLHIRLALNCFSNNGMACQPGAKHALPPPCPLPLLRFELLLQHMH